MNKKEDTTAIENWSLYNALLLLLAFIYVFFTLNLNYLCVAFIISLLGLIYSQRLFLFKRKRPFGIANNVTLLRFILILISFMCVDFNSQKTLFIICLTIAVIFDFFDGIIARRFNETSIFGQYFDMEIDAFFVLMMCCYYYIYEDVGSWILIPGILRYIYRLYTFLVPKKNFKETKQQYATIVAGSFFVILLLGLVLDGWWQLLILKMGALSIIISFAWSFKQYHNA